MTRFRDRELAGRELAEALGRHAGERLAVIGLPRGGVPVAAEVARVLGAPLDVRIVRKIGAPGQPELGLGAVAEGGHIYLDRASVAQVGATDEHLSRTLERERREVEDRVRRLRGARRAVELRDRTVVLVDDGIATGGTVLAAVRAIRDERPRAVVLAAPVAARASIATLEREVDDVVVLQTPADLRAVGFWYEDFGQVSDEEVERLLEAACGARGRDERATP